MADSVKPKVLITGGVGFIGRNFVQYLVEHSLTSKIIVVDKVPPSTGWLNDAQKKAFENVKFIQANLANVSSCESVFKNADGFDYVFHLAGETKYGQTREVYKELVLDVTLNCAQQAAKANVKRFINVSTAQVYNSDKGISKESSKTDPWTLIAKSKLDAEIGLAKINGLRYITVRPAIVYGIGDKLGLMPRLIIGAVYRQLDEKMQLLWTKDLHMNTIHVVDVCKALWHMKELGENGEVYNLVDDGNSTQGSISEAVSNVFKIKHGYYGSILSNLARLNMSDAVEESNEKHLQPWSEACTANGISNTPLTPYIDQELLYNKHLHIDGNKLRQTGFACEKPVVTAELLKEVVDDYVLCGLFPASLIPSFKISSAT